MKENNHGKFAYILYDDPNNLIDGFKNAAKA